MLSPSSSAVGRRIVSTIKYYPSFLYIHALPLPFLAPPATPALPRSHSSDTRLLADNHCKFLFLIPQISHPGSRRARERRAGCTQDGKDATYSRRDNASAAMMLRDRYLMRGNIRVARAGHGGMGHLLVLLLLVGWSQFQRVEGEQQLCESKIFTICIGHHILPLVRQLEGQRQRRLVNAAGDGTRVAARQQGAAATAYVQAGAAVTAYCHSVGQKETCA